MPAAWLQRRRIMQLQREWPPQRTEEREGQTARRGGHKASDPRAETTGRRAKPLPFPNHPPTRPPPRDRQSTTHRDKRAQSENHQLNDRLHTQTGPNELMDTTKKRTKKSSSSSLKRERSTWKIWKPLCVDGWGGKCGRERQHGGTTKKHLRAEKMD